MSQPKCMCVTSGFVRETEFLSKAIEDIEMEFVANTGQGSSESQFEHIPMYIPMPGLAVLTGRSALQNMMLASHVVHQRVFRLGVGCGVFCEDAKAFITGQLSLVSGVGIHKLNSGVIEDEDWDYIAHAIKAIEESPLYLGNLPSSLEALKVSIRDYAALCKAGDKDGDFAVFVFDLSRLIDEQTPLATVLQELNELAVEIDRQIIVVHDASEQREHSEGEVIWKYAGAVLELESLTDDRAILREFSQSIIKGTHPLFTISLEFNANRFLVRLDTNNCSYFQSEMRLEEVGMGMFIKS